MKDYIVAETYIHLKIDPSSQLKASILELLKDKVELYGKEYLSPEAEYICIIEDGSLRVWVVAIGVTIIELISNYGSFRDGIDHIVSDATYFSEHVINEVKNEPNISEEVIFRTERRLGIPGKIQRIYNQAEYIQKNYENLSPNEVRKSLEELQTDIIRVCNTINDNERELFLINLPTIVRESLPKHIPIRPELRLNRYVIREDERRRAQFIIIPRRNRPGS